MANERSYRGPATLTIDDFETGVHADLVTHGGEQHEEWRGTVKADDELEHFGRFADRPATIRIPETHGEGTVHIKGWGGQMARAEGTGAAPF